MYHHLKISASLFTLIAAAFISAPPSLSADGDHSPVEDAMESMQSAYRKVGRAMRKPEENAEQLLAWVQEMQVGAVAAKVMDIHIPNGMGSVEEVQKKYRMEMTRTVIALVKLEQALLAGDFEAAKAAFDKVKALKSEGHDTFKE